MSDDLVQQLRQIVKDTKTSASDSACFNIVLEAIKGCEGSEKDRILQATLPILVADGMVHATRVAEHYFHQGPMQDEELVLSGIRNASHRLDRGDISPNAMARFSYDQSSRLPLETTIDILSFASDVTDNPKACARLLSLYNFAVQKKDYLRNRDRVFHLVHYFIDAEPDIREDQLELVKALSGELGFQQRLLYEAIQRAHEDSQMEEDYHTAEDFSSYQKLWNFMYRSEKSLPSNYAGPATLAADKIDLGGEALRVKLALDALSVMKKFPRGFECMFARKQRVQNDWYEAQEALDLALEQEDYVRAARLRDTISEAERFLEGFD